MKNMETSITNISVIDLPKEELLLEYQSLKQQFSKYHVELESKNQKIYDLKRDLSRLEALESHYLQEVEVLQHNDHAENKKLKEDIQKLNEEVISCRTENNETIKYLEDELLIKNEEIEQLKNDVDKLTKLLEHGNDNTTNYDKLLNENNALKEEIEMLVLNNKDILETIQPLQSKYEEICEEKKNLELELTDIRENYKCKTDQVKESQLLIENLQGELIMLKNELDSFKIKPLDSESRGNSLFAEVNDRRVLLQNRMLSMKTEFTKMKNEHKHLLEKVAALQRENTMLTTRWEEDIKDCKYYDDSLFQVHKEEVANLKEIIELYKQKLEEKLDVTEDTISKDIFFVQNMFKNKDKEIKQLLDKITVMSTTESIMARKITTLNKELCEWKANSCKAECTISELKTEIEQIKCGDENKTICNCDQTKKPLKFDFKKKSFLRSEPLKEPEVLMKYDLKAILLGDKNKSERSHPENVLRTASPEDTNKSEFSYPANVLKPTNPENNFENEVKVKPKSKEQKGVQFAADTKEGDGVFITRRRGKKLTCKTVQVKESEESIEI